MTEREDRTFSRRGFARAVAGGSLIVGFDAMTGSWVSAADAHGTPFANLPFGQAQVRGGIVIDMRSLQQVHTFTADSVEVDAGASWRGRADHPDERPVDLRADADQALHFGRRA